MTATKEGGIKSAETNKKLYGEDFYSKIGKIGGSAPYKKPKGFAAVPGLARRAGKIGGSRSKK